MLDTTDRIWIYLSTDTATRNGGEVTCDYYKPSQLRPKKHDTYDEYNFEFLYEYVTGETTYQLRYSGRVKRENRKEVMELKAEGGGDKNEMKRELEHWDDEQKCGILSFTTEAGKKEYELHVWEERLRYEYERTSSYTGCQEALKKFCNKNRHQRFGRTCKNIGLTNRSAPHVYQGPVNNKR
ncbi:uncharacterized protein LOC125946917 [Dermacentor silvarum]|uniref:uncharacterized protein LOC125946917 n=1 Tax=Dermacentor silvarum TaxID=543639 RepID=UPI0021015614|nr:uncharacterized protein LOC125946917 [Dermacentor silvarum]